MSSEVDAEPLELFARNVADEAVVSVIVVYGLQLAPHFCESVNDDSWNDGSDDQVDEEYVDEVDYVGGERDDAVPLASDWRTCKAVVNVCP